MAKPPTPAEALEAARRLQEDQLAAVKVLAEAQQRQEDVRAETEARIAEVQRAADEQRAAASRGLTQAFSAALKAGWTEADLRKIGYPNPAEKRPTVTRSKKRGGTLAGSRRPDVAAAVRKEPANT